MMIKLKNPSAVYLKGGSHAILLLHSFTGTVRDVKDLAKRLNEAGFTTYAPSYSGHGLILKDFVEYDTDDWWQQVVDSYDFLKQEGYTTISAVGISLGGLFTLKLLETYTDIERSAVMSVPRYKDETGVSDRLQQYGMRLNQMLGMSDEEHMRQLKYVNDYYQGTTKFTMMVQHVMDHLHDIKTPVLVMYGERDDISYADSAQFIYNELTGQKNLESIAEAGHLMTLGRGQTATEAQILAYFGRADI